MSTTGATRTLLHPLRSKGSVPGRIGARVGGLLSNTVIPRISVIVATDQNGLIGKDNKLPWHLPADLAFFKKVTMGKPIIMGRKTFESIGQPLPGRTNIVVTSRTDYNAEGCRIARSLDEAIEKSGQVDEIMVIGGATLYQQALGRADRIYLTLVEAELDGDTWFPALIEAEWLETRATRCEADERNPFAHTFKILERKAKLA